jgi:hypothetical protein
MWEPGKAVEESKERDLSYQVFLGIEKDHNMPG